MERKSGKAEVDLVGFFNSFPLSKLFSGNFQGPKGAKGDQGSAGITGQKGETGEMGLSGPPVRPSVCPCTSVARSFNTRISADAQYVAGFAEQTMRPHCGAGGAFNFLC